MVGLAATAALLLLFPSIVVADAPPEYGYPIIGLECSCQRRSSVADDDQKSFLLPQGAGFANIYPSFDDPSDPSTINLECSCREKFDTNEDQKPLLPQGVRFAKIHALLNDTPLVAQDFVGGKLEDDSFNDSEESKVDTMMRLSNPAAPTVDLGYSIYEGTRLNNGQNQFIGVRYGAPPTGPNRFKKPQPPQNTIGIQKATEFGHVCYAMAEGAPSGYGEDCLFMNIWAPEDSDPGNKYPVFFWLSGGGYFRTANANYNASDLVEFTDNNMIFVGINYRMGPFGFLAGSKMKGQGGDLNNGLHDQRLALKWVQDNISKFGGDPGRVVVAGDSAGAGSIAMHLLAAEQHPEVLFHGAIGISPFFPAQLSHKDLDWQFDIFANRTGCLSSSNVLDCLRQKTPVELANANRKMAYPGHEADEDNNYRDAALAPWTPCIDDDLIVDTPLTLFEIGQFRKIPMIWGSNTDEGTLFVTNSTSSEEVVKFIRANFHKLTQEEATNIVSEYPVEGFKKGKAAYFLSTADAYGDAVLGCPGYELANFMAPYADTWYYRYDVLTNEEEEAGVGVFHMADLPVLFGENNIHPKNRKPGREAYTMSPILRSYFTNFVRYLNPNASPVPGSILWSNFLSPPQPEPQRLHMSLNGLEIESVPRKWITRCQLWKRNWVIMNQ